MSLPDGRRTINEQSAKCAVSDTTKRSQPLNLPGSAATEKRRIHDVPHFQRNNCGRSARRSRMRRRQPARAGAGQYPIHSHRRLSRRPVRLGRLGLLQRHGRLFHHDQRPRRRREQGQADVGRVRNRVQQCARRRVLRAAEEKGADRRYRGAADVHRDYLFDPRPLGCRQDTAGHDRLRPHRHQRRPRLSLRFPDDHQLLEPDHRRSSSSWARSWAAWTS